MKHREMCKYIFNYQNMPTNNANRSHYNDPILNYDNYSQYNMVFVQYPCETVFFTKRNQKHNIEKHFMT